MNHKYRLVWAILLCPILALAQPLDRVSRLLSQIQAERLKGNFLEAKPFAQSDYKPEDKNELVLPDVVFLQPNALVFRQLLNKKAQSLHLEIPSPSAQQNWHLDLMRSEVTSQDFRLTSSDGKRNEYGGALHYRGILNEDPNTSVSLTISDEGLMAVIATKDGNYDLGVYGEKADNQYVLYRGNTIADRLPFSCEAKNQPDEEKNQPHGNTTTDECRVVRVYFECDYALFQSKGSVNAVANYVTGLFNVVAGIYANDSIQTLISEIFVWTSTDPFANLTPSSSVLYSFQSTRTTYNGTLAHLLSTRSANLGGIAFVNVLCNPYSSYAFSNIYNSYSQYPTYSWSVMVVTHEMGHNLGSQHTQWCGWPGGAIDNCYTTEGGCAPGPTPVNGGTIMSYCHLVSGVGINLQNGFGPLPGGVIRSRFRSATCISGALNVTASSSSTATICPGQPVTLSATGASSYSWSPPTGLSATQGSSILASPQTTTTYVVTGQSYGCSGTSSITIPVNPALSFGSLASDNQIFNGSGNPNPIDFQIPPTGGNGSFTYQWYFKNGLNSAPTGASTNGWTPISGATSNSYDPGTVASSISYAVQVDATGTPDCAPFTWASGLRQITVNAASGLNPGVLMAGNQTFCSSGGNPGIITFSQLPSGLPNLTYTWYYRDGSPYPPSGTNTEGWTLIAGAAAGSYDPPFITSSRMYACLVSPVGGVGEWAAGARQITVLPPFQPGTITIADETLCKPADPSPITLANQPVGSSAYKYQWYYQNSLVACPTGSSTTGWTAISGATSSSFDPAAGGTTTNRTFALRVSPSGTPSCGTVQWATNCRKITLPPALNLGTLEPGNESIGYYAIPDTIEFAVAPVGSGSFLYQWYVKDGLASAPTGSSTAGWTALDQETGSTYLRRYGLASTSTFACFVIPAGNPTCGSGGWASGVRQVTVQAPVSFWGTLEEGNQILCYGLADPDTIEFATPPTEISQPSYQWYYWDSLLSYPNMATGILIPGATGNSYDPPAGLTRNRSYSCFIGLPGSQPGGTQGNWVLPIRQITVLPPVETGVIASGDETFCGSGNPSPITLSSNPKGSESYQWRWYYRESATGSCPTGSAIPAGWITNNTSPNITGTTLTGSGISFDPQSAGTLNKGRTFAVFITPIPNSSASACSAPQWASGCRRTFVNTCALEPEIPTKANAMPHLDQSFPNPGFGSISIPVFLPPAKATGRIIFYDILGKPALVLEVDTTGDQIVKFESKLLGPGSYFYRLEVNGELSMPRQMVVH